MPLQCILDVLTYLRSAAIDSSADSMLQIVDDALSCFVPAQMVYPTPADSSAIPAVDADFLTPGKNCIEGWNLVKELRNKIQSSGQDHLLPGRLCWFECELNREPGLNRNQQIHRTI